MRTPFSTALTPEWIENTFPEKTDEEGSNWVTLPFGYTLGPWIKNFQNTPVVTRLTYHKGPPQKFIQNIIQVWKPVEVELTLDGPKTIEANMSAQQWKECFAQANSCGDEKKKFHAYATQDFPRGLNQGSYTWFDSQDFNGARGVHTHLEAGTYFIDRFTVITPQGIAQNFSLKYVNSETGKEAHSLFLKIMGGLKVKDELNNPREWIQNKISHVNLDQIRAIPDAKLRFQTLIQVQNWIFALLSVDPSRIEPFFHLAGVTHLLAMELLKTNQNYFDGQEACINSAKPLLETLILYAKDFEKSETLVKNMESLLQDILLLQEKISGKR